MTGKFHEFDLAIRSEVQIEARLAAVWQGLERIEAWKSSVAGIERLGGPVGGVGEILRVTQKAGEGLVHVIHRTIELERDSWRVQWMETEDGRSVRGYLSYSLRPLTEGTLLMGQLLARAVRPAGSVYGRPDEEASRMIVEATRDKFHSDHLELKRLAETGRFG